MEGGSFGAIGRGSSRCPLPGVPARHTSATPASRFGGSARHCLFERNPGAKFLESGRRTPARGGRRTCYWHSRLDGSCAACRPPSTSARARSRRVAAHRCASCAPMGHRARSRGRPGGNAVRRRIAESRWRDSCDPAADDGHRRPDRRQSRSMSLDRSIPARFVGKRSSTASSRAIREHLLSALRNFERIRGILRP